ncbi:hypothetical protein [Candidatus Magnetobacterium casense]|uniref:Uncharacterized protein n=1 Tax=Candidatus Magnetobacterium casense TaxID=1455061 RepID=A0ABS6S303_9BACT|nr:hypothetical protein [Candidatus Magnetobacterium casensis]MBV6343228.1 hypothetical protein [Candidatus Magnetobacterium casensis]
MSPVSGSHTQDVTSPTISGAGDLSPDYCSHDGAATSPALSHIYVLSPAPGSHEQEVTSPTLSGAGDLTPDYCSHDGAVTSPVLSHIYVLTPVNCSHDGETGSPALSHIYVLSPVNCEHLQECTATSAGAIDLTPVYCSHDQAVTSPPVGWTYAIWYYVSKDNEGYFITERNINLYKTVEGEFYFTTRPDIIRHPSRIQEGYKRSA